MPKSPPLPAARRPPPAAARRVTLGAFQLPESIGPELAGVQQHSKHGVAQLVVGANCSRTVLKYSPQSAPLEPECGPKINVLITQSTDSITEGVE